MALAKAWLDDCIDNHKMCPSSSHQMPTRVIRVGSAGMNPVLYVTEDDCSSYVALSHCWGDSRIFCTENATINQRKEGMPMESLPKTFHDAVVITRNLGIEYLWIDSLCILQDSEEDWNRESAKMAVVYSGATVVISADAARNSADGCFGPYKHSRDRNISISIPCINDQSAHCQVYARKIRSRGFPDGLEHHIKPTEPRWAIEELPITRRGWW